MEEVTVYYLMRKNVNTLKYETDLSIYGTTPEEVMNKVEEETGNLCYIDNEGDDCSVNVPYIIFREFRPLNDTDTPYGIIYSIG